MGNTRSLIEEIERSKELLKLEDNFDGEGSPHYSEETLKRAWGFLKLYEKKMQEEGKNLEVPSICAGPHGTIDIDWHEGEFVLLLNIPIDSNKKIAYYGDEKGANKIKGLIDATEYKSELANYMRKRNA